MVPLTGCACVFVPGVVTSWVYRYRSGRWWRSAKIRSIKLGSYPTLSIDAARAAAKAHAGQIARGIDPAVVRQEKRRSEKATLGGLLAIDGPYETSLKARGIIKVRTALSSLRRGLVRYMDADIAKLSRRDLVEALETLARQTGCPGGIEKMHEVVARMGGQQRTGASQCSGRDETGAEVSGNKTCRSITPSCIRRYRYRQALGCCRVQWNVRIVGSNGTADGNATQRARNFAMV